MGPATDHPELNGIAPHRMQSPVYGSLWAPLSLD